ncbi:hypothetical protein DM860_004147 [Cuscuta australis]|uniref:Fibronectin type-III domain-containing protein n=1 Tax=Cuscuta australis TaxID=267555 RepID=A0A328CVF1_9ASTE|nr:hypothetical protein DM860_004147 [Cuscuta australis]
MSEQPPKLSKRTNKGHEHKKSSSSPKDSLSKKQQRKGENPVRIPLATEQCSDFKCSSSWICKNSACRATIPIDDTFCKRCSCCICHLFDDNKDPSLWLECASETGHGESCGLTCHIECAIQRGKVGVVNLGQLMQLDGSYCCASCGKVSGILGYWKKQLSIAKDARRVDILCYRIHLCYRLFDGTCRFGELHEIIKDAKAKLETEVGPLNGVSAKMARGIVSRLPVAVDVQLLCSLAIEKADEFLAAKSCAAPNLGECSLPAACKFLLEEVTSSSVVIVLIELSAEDVKGYKLWYCRNREDAYTKEPVCVFPRSQRRILISNLLPCTEYCFRIVSYAEAGDLGHSEAKCFTKSVEIFSRTSSEVARNQIVKHNSDTGGSSSSAAAAGTVVESDSGFKVRDLGRILRLAWAQQKGCCSSSEIEMLCGIADTNNNKAANGGIQKDQKPPASRQLDLNVASVPDLNEELTPPVDSSRDEVEEEDNGSDEDDSLNWNKKKKKKKRGHGNNGGETHDSDSTLINDGSPTKSRNGCFDENFEYCVKIIRWLECEGYIEKDFRLKLLTWFSLRSTEQERRVVNTFIQTLMDDPISLAGQLVDSFSDMVSNKRARNSFCTRLWH